MTDPEHPRIDLEPLQRRNRTQMLAIACIALATLAASYGAFYLAKTSGGWGTTNHGDFVSPPTTTAELGWQVEGEQRRWWVWMVAGTCAADCRATAAAMQAVHKLLNRDVDRVRRGFTPADGMPLPAWLSDYPQLAVVSVAELERVSEGVYIVDPNGNLVLMYPLHTEPRLVLEDLKRLLKISQIG
jgi:hypothetical protein